MAPRCGAGHCGSGGRAPPPEQLQAGRTWAPPAALRCAWPGLGGPGVHGSERSDTAGPAPAGHCVSPAGFCLLQSRLRCRGAGCSHPAPSPGPGSSCGFLRPHPRAPAAARIVRGRRLGAAGAQRSPMPWAAPRSRSRSLGAPWRRRRGAGFPGRRCRLAVPAVPAPPPPLPPACSGWRAPDSAPREPRPRPAPSATPPLPRVGCGLLRPAGRFRALRSVGNRPRCTPLASRPDNALGAGSSSAEG